MHSYAHKTSFLSKSSLAPRKSQVSGHSEGNFVAPQGVAYRALCLLGARLAFFREPLPKACGAYKDCELRIDLKE
jgi:hypothetical protein